SRLRRQVSISRLSLLRRVLLPLHLSRRLRRALRFLLSFLSSALAISSHALRRSTRCKREVVATAPVRRFFSHFKRRRTATWLRFTRASADGRSRGCEMSISPLVVLVRFCRCRRRFSLP